jgi:hypothetical protein
MNCFVADVQERKFMKEDHSFIPYRLEILNPAVDNMILRQDTYISVFSFLLGDSGREKCRQLVLGSNS